MKEFFRNLRWLAITGDVVVLSASYFGAAFAVLGRLGFPKAIPEIVAGYPLLVGLAIVAFSLRGVYKSLIRYTSISTYIRIGQAIAMAVAVATYPFFALNLSDLIPWRLLPVFAALAFGTSSMIRTVFAVLQTRPKAGQGRRVLIYGAGEGGALAARDLLQARGAIKSAAQLSRFLPIVLPLLVSTHHSQINHMFSIINRPPCTSYF